MKRLLKTHLSNPILLPQTTLGGLLNVIEKRANLLNSGDTFWIYSLMFDNEIKRFKGPELGKAVNDILMATRKYEMISNVGGQKYHKL